MTIQIVVKQDILKGAPGEHLGQMLSRNFKGGEEVWIGFVPTTDGRNKELETVDQLSFWTGADIDYGLIFTAKEIAELRISEDDKRLEFLQRKWPDGPIKVLPHKWWMLPPDMVYCTCKEQFTIKDGICQSCGMPFFFGMSTSREYARPELTEKDLIQARMDAQKLIRKHGMNNLPKMLAALVAENVRLVKEINEHRAARGIEPLETFKV